MQSGIFRQYSLSSKTFSVMLTTEISSFETTAFNRRQTEKVGSKRSPAFLVKPFLQLIVSAFGLSLIWRIISEGLLTNSVTGHIVTPQRLLVIITVFFIGITPMIKGKFRQAGVVARLVPPSTRPTPAQIDGSAMLSSPIKSAPALETSGPTVQRYTSQFVSGLAPVPSRYDPVPTSIGRRSTMTHAPAPFVDDIHSTQKHEFSEAMPHWARKFEELFVKPSVIDQLVIELEQSNRELAAGFNHFGIRLSQEVTSDRENGVVYLADRFLPSPLSSSTEMNLLWNRRQKLEVLLNIPGFSPTYRDYVVSRIKEWATRGGLRYSYRHDQRPNNQAPTDSHILAHLLFKHLEDQLGGHFADRFVLNAAGSTGATTAADEFKALFSSIGSKTSHYSKIVWLEQSALQGPDMRLPLHFNVGTNQRVYGVQSGAGNMLEALCLFFHLLKRLSPSAMWVQIPHELRLVIESVLGSYGRESAGVTGGMYGLASGLTSGKAALGGPLDHSSYRGY